MGKIFATSTVGFLAFILLVWVAVDVGVVLSQVEPVTRLPRRVRVLMNPGLAERETTAPDV